MCQVGRPCHLLQDAALFLSRNLATSEVVIECDRLLLFHFPFSFHPRSTPFPSSLTTFISSLISFHLHSDNTFSIQKQHERLQSSPPGYCPLLVNFSCSLSCWLVYWRWICELFFDFWCNITMNLNFQLVLSINEEGPIKVRRARETGEHWTVYKYWIICMNLCCFK